MRLSEEPMRRRLLVPAAALLAILLFGMLGYHHLGGGRWSLGDCLYMTIITLTTVGYGEVLHGMELVPHARQLTSFLIVSGMGLFLYFASHITATVIEGDLQRALRKTRMRKKIMSLKDHVVICGVGSTGRHVLNELIAVERPCVAVDTDQERLERHARRLASRRFFYLVGDATDDTVLEAANLARAAGLVASLPNDKDNLYLVVSARQANQSARIVARGSDLAVLEKLKKAGADTVVSPNFIGGMRMASELVRPHVVRFLDEMLRDHRGRWRIEEVVVDAGSRLHGTSLREADLRGRLGIAVLAVRDQDDQYRYNPGPELTLDSRTTLVVLGRHDQVQELRKLAEGCKLAEE